MKQQYLVHFPPSSMTMHRLVVVVLTAVSAQTFATSNEDGMLEPIAGFQPVMDVRDYADLDLDMVQIEKLLAAGELEDAKRVYELGAHSRSYAELSLGFDGLPGDVGVHTIASGMSVSGEPITGVGIDEGKIGAKVVKIRYHNDENPVQCFVGGNPEPVTEGCFAPTGQLSFDHFDKVVPYSYNVQHQNHNDRVLAWLSMHAETKMRPCPRCEFLDDFYKYFVFYGKADFAHRWIMAALTGSRTVFDSSAVDLTTFGPEARSAAARTAIATLSMFPYVIRQLELSVHECRKDCPAIEGCGDTAIRSADSAVALYAGSLEDGSGSGSLLYSIAEEECKHFNTCTKKGQSTVNTIFMSEMEAFQTNITNRDCWDAHGKKETVARQMKVPLVQGTLRYAYQRAFGTELSQTDIATGAAFAASVVPMIASCSFKDAEIINNNMETVSEKTDFRLVKDALEKHYGCIGITCKDVGGVWDSKTHKYMEYADPCTFDEVPVEKPKRSKKTILLGFGIPLCLAVVLASMRLKHVLHQRYKQRKEEFPDEYSDSEEDDNFDLHLT